MQRSQAASLQARDFQPDRIGTDIDGGERGHGKAHSLHPEGDIGEAGCGAGIGIAELVGRAKKKLETLRTLMLTETKCDFLREVSLSSVGMVVKF
jgi:hypothetical protein